MRTRGVPTTATKLRYERVIELVERLIAEAGSIPGSKLPSRQQLAQMAGVSMISVRRALDELERAGRVTSQQGVGTFVSRPRIVMEPGRTGPLLDTLGGYESPPPLTTHVLELRQGLPGASIADALNLGPDARVWLVLRLRELDGSPAILEQAAIPASLAPDLDLHVADLSTSLYGLLSRVYGISDDSEEQYLEVAQATGDEQRHLGLAHGEQVVRLRGISYDRSGVAFDCFQQVYPAEGFVFYVAGRTAHRVFRGADVREWHVVPIDGARDDLSANEGRVTSANVVAERLSGLRAPLVRSADGRPADDVVG
jgi:DNA-binding GntR family transcriptional regulator